MNRWAPNLLRDPSTIKKVEWHRGYLVSLYGLHIHADTWASTHVKTHTTTPPATSAMSVHRLLTEDNFQVQCQVTPKFLSVTVWEVEFPPHKNECGTEKWRFQCQLMFQGLGNCTMVNRYADFTSDCDIQIWNIILNSFNVIVLVFHVMLAFKIHGFIWMFEI